MLKTSVNTRPGCVCLGSQGTKSRFQSGTKSRGLASFGSILHPQHDCWAVGGPHVVVLCAAYRLLHTAVRFIEWPWPWPNNTQCKYQITQMEQVVL
jgi:hypothetical protein